MLARCCCGAGCQIASDDFDRADSTDIGADWDEVAGDWEIASNVLRVESSDALARHQSPQPDNEFGLRVIADVKGDSDGDQLRVFGPQWGDDDAIYAELTVDDGDCGDLTLYRLAGGVATQIGGSVAVPAAPAEWHRITLCYRDEYPLLPHVTAKIVTADGTTRWTGAFVDVTGETPDGTGITGGLGTGSITSGAEFDNFDVDVTRYSPDRASCPHCRPPCDLFEDAFTRDDSTDVGCEWEEISGGWEVSSTELACTSAGLIRCKVPIVLPPYFNVSARLEGTTGQKACIVADCSEDGSTYVAGEVTFGPTGTLKIITSDGTTLVSETGSFASGTYNLCYDGTYVIFGEDQFTVNHVSVEAAYTPSTDRPYAGLSGDAGTVFDNFDLNHGQSDYLPDCNGCIPFPTCNLCNVDHEPPDELIVDLTDIDVSDGECDDCDDVIPAVYVVRKLRDVPCELRHTEFGSCDLTGTPDVFGTACANVTADWSFIVRAFVRNNIFTGEREWAVQFLFSGAPDDPFNADCDWNHQSNFMLSVTKDMECDEMPITVRAVFNSDIEDSYPTNSPRIVRKICYITPGEYDIELSV